MEDQICGGAGINPLHFTLVSGLGLAHFRRSSFLQLGSIPNISLWMILKYIKSEVEDVTLMMIFKQKHGAWEKIWEGTREHVHSQEVRSHENPNITWWVPLHIGMNARAFTWLGHDYHVPSNRGHRITVDRDHTHLHQPHPFNVNCGSTDGYDFLTKPTSPHILIVFYIFCLTI